eukprot:gnl/MRDRNA2_/MRDRNA2_180143_c0_seq1.p1 gnl/MRDRNA2_/MRDRNA2_180143_c0~~gnl/MRDRNA2_/MRDRNA2_180143_c0_seq1.p1  ORF type:complete len:486 (+),score=72.03 gnl/MRDRNA2_/MRDRNA2_180143_c0_seq1:194-1459(+)
MHASLASQSMDTERDETHGDLQALSIDPQNATGRTEPVCAFYLWLPVHQSAPVTAHDLAKQMWNKFPNLFQVGEYRNIYSPWVDSLVHGTNKVVKMNNRLFYQDVGAPSSSADSYIWANIGGAWYSGNNDQRKKEQWKWFAVPYYSKQAGGCIESSNETALQDGMKVIAEGLYNFCVKENDATVCAPLENICDSIDTSEKMGGGDRVLLKTYLSGYVGKCQGKAIDFSIAGSSENPSDSRGDDVEAGAAAKANPGSRNCHAWHTFVEVVLLMSSCRAGLDCCPIQEPDSLGCPDLVPDDAQYKGDKYVFLHVYGGDQQSLNFNAVAELNQVVTAVHSWEIDVRFIRVDWNLIAEADKMHIILEDVPKDTPPYVKFLKFQNCSGALIPGGQPDAEELLSYSGADIKAHSILNSMAAYFNSLT